jgi:hypothetical protein
MASWGISACSDEKNGTGDAGQDGNTGYDGSHVTDRGDTGGDIPICDEVDLKASSLANVLLVIDKSKSMNDRTAAASDRAKIEDLRDAVHFMLDEYQDTIRFGWMAFPDSTDCGPGVVSVPIGDDTGDTIRSLVDSMAAWGLTPTGESLQNAGTDPGLLDPERRNFILLITDGMPTCPNGDGFPNQADNALALQAVTDLHSSGIDTYVIGLGEDVNNSNPQLLSDMATAGGHPRPGPVAYYQANSLAELTAAFEEIAMAVFECNLLLEVIPQQPEWIWVYFDGVPVTRDRNHVDGWDYDRPANRIDFYGPTCARLENGEVSKIDVVMGCGPPD